MMEGAGGLTGARPNTSTVCDCVTVVVTSVGSFCFSDSQHLSVTRTASKHTPVKMRRHHRAVAANDGGRRRIIDGV